MFADKVWVARERIRTSDPQIRSLKMVIETARFFCKPESFEGAGIIGLQPFCKLNG